MNMRKDIICFIGLSIGIFLFLSLLSYQPTDPSLNNLKSAEEVLNFCGYAGAILADLLFQSLGIMSWFLVFLLSLFSILSFKKEPVYFKSFYLIASLSACLVLCALIQIYSGDERFFDSQILLGGSIGYFLSEILVTIFNPLGAILVLLSVSVGLLMYFFEFSYSKLEDFLDLLPDKFSFILSLKEKLLKLKGKPLVSMLKKQKKPEVKKAQKEIKDLSNFSFEKQEALIEEDEDFEEVDEEDEEVLDSETDSDDLSEMSEVTEKAFYGEETSSNAKVVKRKKVKRWKLPDVNLLEDHDQKTSSMSDKKIKERSEQLVSKLSQLRVYGEVVGASAGPVVTLFEFRPKADIKVSSITNLDDDLSLALSSQSVRIIAPIPGKDVVGVETSNLEREIVYLKDCLLADEFWLDQYKIPIPLGKRVDGKVKIVDLANMPHLLVAGTTGSGKSVFTVSSIISLIFRHSPETLKMILIDPKQVDLTVFEDIPHLVTPIIRDPKKAVGALKWAVREMEKRYRSMSVFGARGLDSYNEIVKKLSSAEVKKHSRAHEEFPGGEKDPIKSYYYQPLPYLCIFIEEFGDLITVDKANVENSVVRIAQMARACGVHLVIATQSPRKDVVTGLIKTNIPGRISFKVASKMDSRIILDEGGAERLLTKGDMLFLAPGVSKPGRHHGPWLSDEEIQEITQFWKDQWDPKYDEDFEQKLEQKAQADFFDVEEDDRYEEILEYVQTLKEVSASLIQRRFRLGYPRAARLIELLEKRGIVGESQGSKPRKVLSSYSKEV